MVMSTGAASDFLKTRRPHVNGALLERFSKQPVCLYATVRNVQANGKIISLQTTDQKMPVAYMVSPLTGPLAEGTLVEVNGVVENPNKITCHELHVLGADMGPLDADTYNEYVTLMADYPDLDEVDAVDNLGPGGTKEPEIYELEDFMRANDQGEQMEVEGFGQGGDGNPQDTDDYFAQL